MKKNKSLTREEVLELCIRKKLEGGSFADIVNIFRIHHADNEMRKFVLKKLDDRERQWEIQKFKARRKIKKGLIYILCGIGVVLTDVLLFNHIFIWILAAFLLFRGLMSLFSGMKNSKSKY